LKVFTIRLASQHDVTQSHDGNQKPTAIITGKGQSNSKMSPSNNDRDKVSLKKMYYFQTEITPGNHLDTPVEKQIFFYIKIKAYITISLIMLHLACQNNRT